MSEQQKTEEELLQESVKNTEEYAEEQRLRESVIMTNASVPMFINGRPLRAKCFSDQSYDELDGWLKSQFIKVARESSKGLSSFERKEITEAAIRVSMGISWLSSEGQAIVNTVEGIAYIAYMLVRDQHPEITYEWLKEACRVTFNVEEVGRVFTYFNEELDKLKARAANSGKNSSGNPSGKN